MKNALFALAFALCLVGCSGLGDVKSSNPVVQNAVVAGPYTAILTSTKGNGTTNVYTNPLRANISETGLVLLINEQ